MFNNSCELIPARVINLELAKFNNDELATREWRDVYPNGQALQSADVLLTYVSPPQPIIHADPPNSKSRYGDRNPKIDYALNWFAQNLVRARFEGSQGRTIFILKNTLISWAQANALSGNLGDSEMPNGIEYTVSVLILGIENSISTIIPILNYQEKKIIGHWMDNLIKRVANSRFGDTQKTFRASNGPYRQALIVLLWALIIDDDLAVQSVIDTYKTAIHDMRPDGTFVIDSNRGGMGLQYQSVSTNNLIMIASLIKFRYNIDLYKYSVNGRSIETAIEWVIKSISEMGKLNLIYARPCPNAGDRWGAVNAPSRGFVNHLHYLVVHARINKDSPNKNKILSQWGYFFTHKYSDNEINGGSVIALFAIKPIAEGGLDPESDKAICTFALTADKSEFSKTYSFKKYVDKAKLKNLSPDICRNILESDQ